MKALLNKVPPVLVILLLVLIILPATNAYAQGGDAAKMGEVVLKSIPAQQSVGGKIELRIYFNIYGGCCYNLYARGVRPELQLPPEFQLSSGPSPSEYGEIIGLSGGEAVRKYFSFEGYFTKSGSYDIEARIISDNSGRIIGKGLVKIVSGPAISQPILFPKEPDTDKDLHINVEIFSPIPGVNVTGAKMYQFISSVEFDDPKAVGDKLKVNRSGKTRIYQAEEKNMQWSPEYPDTYTAIYEPFKEEKFIYYWYVAEDSDGLVVTSQVNTAEINDISATYTRTRSVFVSFVLATAVGIFLIVFLLARGENARKLVKTKLLRLGSSGNIDFTRERDKPKPVRPIAVYAAFLIILVIALIFLVYAIRFDGFNIIMDFIRDGK